MGAQATPIAKGAGGFGGGGLNVNGYTGNSWPTTGAIIKACKEQSPCQLAQVTAGGWCHLFVRTIEASELKMSIFFLILIYNN